MHRSIDRRLHAPPFDVGGWTLPSLWSNPPTRPPPDCLPVCRRFWPRDPPRGYEQEGHGVGAPKRGRGVPAK
jgi:hypothetical protein